MSSFLERLMSSLLIPRSFENRIEEEMEDISTLLLSAKYGKWDKVWRIIGTPEKPNKAYLINCIPENRRWAVLHQAVYWKDPNNVRKLLQFHECDPFLRAKECTSEVGPTSGMDAEEIAVAYGYTEVKKVLSEHIENFKEVNEEIDTFQPWHTDIERKGRGLIAITLAAYKNTFHPNKIDPEKSVLAVLEDIFNDLTTSDSRWREIRDKICDSLYVVNDSTSNTLKSCSSIGDFYKKIVNVYTVEKTYLYAHMNTALRRQQVSGYKPKANDLATGPYAVMYQILLLFWGKLKRENALTYRQMLLTKNDLDKYQVGVKFTWLAFISSSVDPKKATPFPTCNGAQGENKVTFTIDNTTNSLYQPRNIEKYAKFEENERVYPAGAQFEVTKRFQIEEITHVRLRLLSR
ncbi:hypothetical protein CHS0354_002100 [Potamilus streckersoni]|uniref:Uncharacterized protein n=1 Tax=Potamilus streckersoni TaxID=2493646 RepID=A0AAE0SU06_9BIVA|nr:hypothetical protein CHS0354_002100 [Potamilus streckersoni]